MPSDAALEAPLFHGAPASHSHARAEDGRMSNIRYAQTDCLESIFVICATVEERPLQGRVSQRIGWASAPVVDFGSGQQS
jgi:hypothetical protein